MFDFLVTLQHLMPIEYYPDQMSTGSLLEAYRTTTIMILLHLNQTKKSFRSIQLINSHLSIQLLDLLYRRGRYHLAQKAKMRMPFGRTQFPRKLQMMTSHHLPSHKASLGINPCRLLSSQIALPTLLTQSLTMIQVRLQHTKTRTPEMMVRKRLFTAQNQSQHLKVRKK